MLAGTALDAQAQAKASGRARLLNSTGSVVASCDGYSLTAGSDGSLEVTCSSTTSTSPPPPTTTYTVKGVIAFQSASNPSVPQNQSIPLVLMRNPQGTAGVGVVSTLLDVAYGPCVTSNGTGRATVGFNDGEGGSKTVYLTANGTGTCGIRVVTGDADPAATGITSTFVTVTAATGPVTSNPPPTTGGTCVNAAGQSIPEPSNIVMQTMIAGGTNNYVFDGTVNSTSPQGTIQVFPLPKVWLDGSPLTGASAVFASYVNVNLAGAVYEVSISKCKGDFSYYKTTQASVAYPGSNQVFYPCGLTAGADMSVGWSDTSSIYTCMVPANEQWYMNWRVSNCPSGYGHTCGQTFYLPRG
jgi:hypothetical protein